MNQESTTSQVTLFEHCLQSLLALEDQQNLTPKQQDLYDRIIACERPEDWPEEHFSTEIFQEILEQSRKLEHGSDKVYTLQSRFEDLPPARAPLSNYI